MHACHNGDGANTTRRYTSRDGSVETNLSSIGDARFKTYHFDCYGGGEGAVETVLQSLIMDDVRLCVSDVIRE